MELTITSLLSAEPFASLPLEQSKMAIKQEIVLERRLMGALKSFPLETIRIGTAFTRRCFKAHGYFFCVVSEQPVESIAKFERRMKAARTTREAVAVYNSLGGCTFWPISGTKDWF